MKTKSLFISTIAMVVLLVVALATGTFAWYTSQANVSAEQTALSAAISNSTAIGIGWIETAQAPSVTFKPQESGLRPMIPTTDPATYTGTTALPFNEAVLKTNLEPTSYIYDGVSAPPWTPKENVAENPKETLYIHNIDTAQNINVTVTVDLTTPADGYLDSLIRVSIFYNDAGAHAYVGTWSGGGTAYAGDIDALKLASAADDLTTFFYPSGAENSLTSSAATIAVLGDNAPSPNLIPIIGGGNKQLYVYAWLEGGLLTTENMEDSAATFTISFTASPAA